MEAHVPDGGDGAVTGRAAKGDPAAAAHILCRLDEIPDGAARGFEVGQGMDQVYVFVVRQGGRVHGYLNACPHIGTPLDMVPDQFLTEDKRHILCMTHGARFRIYDGHCFTGPCQGDKLTAVPVAVRGGAVVLDGPLPGV
jgi:nitrite reductase/ring-hydroxylating ferredoxin subunit